MRSEELSDSYRLKGARKIMVENLKRRGIQDEPVLAALLKVPRHYFFHKDFWDHAYEDKAFKIDAGQTISQPYTVAYQTELLKIQKGDKVLEIGTGSGYQTCILLELGAKVYTIERQKELHLKSKKMLQILNYKAQFFLGDGSKGLPDHAPFDKIIVTAGAPTVPTVLMSQLAPGGILVIPIGDDKVQKMNLFKRISVEEFHHEELESFRFVPLIGEQAW